MIRTADANLPDFRGRVLVVDDHASARESMSDVLLQAGHRVTSCSSAVEALQRLQQDNFDVVITDLQMPGMDGVEFITHIERRNYGVQTVMVTAHASVATAVEAMRHGAFDYIEKPFQVDQLEQLVHRALQRGTLLDRHSPVTATIDDAGPTMIGDGPAMRSLVKRIRQVATTDETVLISGESGTGKELVARLLHSASGRASAPLVSLNCPVLSAQLMESELFGHERGAFTSADASRTGRFELADGGTILLDEVTEIEGALQAKLLRVLQERSFERVGSSQTVSVDVRVIATTNRDLQSEVAAGRFREDLYYRLAVVPLHIPPLRERREDVPLLVNHFLQLAAKRLDMPHCQLDDSARDLLISHVWPGNVRELQNIITRACVLKPDQTVGAEDLRPWLINSPQSYAANTAAHLSDPIATNNSNHKPAVPVGLSLQEMERQLIEATLNYYNGHRAKTAQALGIGLRTLSGKLKSYGYAPRQKSLAGTN